MIKNTDSKTASARFDCFEPDGNLWEELDSNGVPTGRFFQVPTRNHETGEGYFCEVCEKGFTQKEWDNRHDDGDPDVYFHGECRVSRLSHCRETLRSCWKIDE